MCPKILSDASLYPTLLRIDRDLADQTRRAGCRCGGRLHSARYRRKPRGGPDGLGEDAAWRFSFCCRRHGCRRRSTPPSVRFLGRRVYFAAVVLLVAVFRDGLTPGRFAELRVILDVSRRTVERWRRWWRASFPRTRVWRSVRARFSPPADEQALPGSALERFAGDDLDRVIAFLRVLALLGANGFVQAGSLMVG